MVFTALSVEDLLQYARKQGLVCRQALTGLWQISAADEACNWYLEQEQERWVLHISDVPQISFHTAEALRFLERYQVSQTSQALDQALDNSVETH
ncbi:MAG: hypothetical protein AAGF24_00880 [Cyanobacteria bacterium P01_H01_bin.121]